MQGLKIIIDKRFAKKPNEYRSQIIKLGGTAMFGRGMKFRPTGEIRRQPTGEIIQTHP
jgi:hypothetical protein